MIPRIYFSIFCFAHFSAVQPVEKKCNIEITRLSSELTCSVSYWQFLVSQNCGHIASELSLGIYEPSVLIVRSARENIWALQLVTTGQTRTLKTIRVHRKARFEWSVRVAIHA